jgi:multidrug resistance efflux pump
VSRKAARTLAAREAECQRLVKGLRPEEVAQAKARHDQLKARLDLLEAGPRSQEVKAASARVQAAQAERNLAEQLYERHATLAQSDATTAEDLDRTRQAFDSAIAMLTVRENELELLEIGTREEELRAASAAVEEARQAWQMASRGFREEEIDQAKAARDAAQAAVEAIRRQKEELVIKSPLDGVIDALDLQPGDIVAASAPVMSIIDHRRLWVRAYVPQNRVGLQLGRKLKVTVDSFPDQTFFGSVTFIAQQTEFTPSNIQTPEEREKQVFRIKVKLGDGGEQLRPGMTADIWLDPIGEVP